MEFDWTDEQHAVRDAARRLLGGDDAVSAARSALETGSWLDSGRWAKLAEQLGAHAIALPEEVGGTGGSLVDLCIVLEEMGRVLYGGPFFATVALAATAINTSGDESARRRYLPQIAAGELKATVAAAEVGNLGWLDGDVHTTATGGERPTVTGAKTLVLDADQADLLIVSASEPAGVSLFAVRADQAQIHPRHVLDATHSLCEVVLHGAQATRLGAPGDGPRILEQTLQTGVVCMAAEQCGATAALLDRTTDYAKTRHQFGRPIGSFQAVKHGLANILVSLELSRSAAFWAAWQEPGTDDFALGAAVARSQCSETALQAAKDCIVLHGGIGFTWEHDAHLYTRRARTSYSLLGTPAQWRERLAAVVAPEHEGVGA
jgi:alkylation response protein AidB-like acyl-CoA dehydrogenase